MPGQDRFWLDDGQRRAPVALETGETDPQEADFREPQLSVSGRLGYLSCGETTRTGDSTRLIRSVVMVLSER
jgi:hypothetical protein